MLKRLMIGFVVGDILLVILALNISNLAHYFWGIDEKMLFAIRYNFHGGIGIILSHWVITGRWAFFDFSPKQQSAS